MERRSTRTLPLLLGLLLAVAGCGGGSKQHGVAKRPSPQATETGSSTTAPQGEGRATRPRTGTEPKSPEQQPGGAGDEQPARVPASFTGRGGRISPRTVHVPPYIALLVELRSGDGRSYELRFPGASVRVGPGRKAASALLGGLRSGRSVNGTAAGGGAVRVEANAEPGP